MTPTTVTGPETYEALQKGMLDAAPVAYELIKSYKWYEVAKYLVYPMLLDEKKQAEARVDELYDLSPETAFRDVKRKLSDHFRKFLEEKANSLVLHELSMLGDVEDEEELNRELELLEEFEDEENWGNFYSGLDDWEKPLDI